MLKQAAGIRWINVVIESLGISKMKATFWCVLASIICQLDNQRNIEYVKLTAKFQVSGTSKHIFLNKLLICKSYIIYSLFCNYYYYYYYFIHLYIFNF